VVEQDDPVLCQVDGQVATLTLNRPAVMNAMGGALRERFLERVETLEHDPDIWVVIITGAGERAFSAGADLKERNTMSGQAQAEMRRISCGPTVLNMLKPTIAAVNGFALGGGCELALACDLRVAAEEAIFGLTEVRVGILPGGGGTQLLPRLIGATRAKEMIYTARRISAAEAERFGLVNAVVPRAELLPRARELADAICANAPLSVRQSKLAIDAGLNTDLRTGLVIENEAYMRVLLSSDREEGIRAFNEKRPPRFTGT
jgi:enoyl-CoA hydratase/carnithine racemase